MSEPECTAEGGTYTEGCSGNTAVDDMDKVIKYSMDVGGTTLIDPSWNVYMKDVDTLWVPLGKLEPQANVSIKQTYTMDETAGNEYQGDVITFNIDLYAEQLMGSGPVHTTTGLVLENKDQTEWYSLVDGTWAVLNWDTSGNYTMRAFGLNNANTYRFSYWNGSSEAGVSGYASPTGGALTLTGTYAGLNTNTGAKYWLRPNDWDNTKSLWEANLVN